MNMQPVSSSNISSIGYENGILYIRFHAGGLYSYSGVPESVYNSLMSASSHGGYLAAHIKGVYPYTKIG
ncbi:KTSC domain-containing protein [Acetobacterium wieringae]|uniref:KTSC domain-containing protein n=1 Tax=Acetobacterium wieringae TaxID=52694 RepID=UPI0020337C2C|nr:KTSC domain-containing protein [Acetobacterium wieringae]URN84003.1 KTSC domain-containing protein [Acetobacterium wieringae]